MAELLVAQRGRGGWVGLFGASLGPTPMEEPKQKCGQRKSWRDFLAQLALAYVAVFYFLSFFLPAAELHDRNNEGSWIGWAIFRAIPDLLPMFWRDLDYGMRYRLMLMWLSNVALWFGFLLLIARLWRVAFFLGCVGLVGVALSWTFKIPADVNHFAKVNPPPVSWIEFREGYYFWAGSILLLTLVALYRSLSPPSAPSRFSVAASGRAAGLAEFLGAQRGRGG